MCSSPKGGSGGKRPSSKVESLSDGMSAGEYSAMIQRANESYERRQEELAEIRAERKTTLTNIQPHSLPDKQNSKAGLPELLRNFFSKYIYSH